MSDGEAAPFPRRAPDDIVPVTAEQRHIWLDLVRANGGLAYHEPMIVRFDGPTTPRAIAESIRLLVARHEALRVSIDDRDGEPVQLVHDEIDVLLPTTDLSHLAPVEQEAAVRALAASDAATPFDLARPPLMRARVVRLNATDHRVVLVLHHILFDGRSLAEALMRELPVLHEAVRTSRPPTLPQPVAQYGDYAAWQRAAHAGKDWARDLDYWQRSLAGGTRDVALPYDRLASDTAERVAATISLDIDAGLMRGVDALARAHATSAYTVLLAAFVAQLRRYGRDDDITVSSVIDTRGSARLGGMLGYCLNTIALRSRPRLDQPFAELLDETRNLLFGAYEHAAVPFERVVQMLDGAVPGAQDGRFHVMFSMQPALPGGNGAVSIETLTPPRAKADLYIEVEPLPDGLQARFTYDRSLFDSETARRMAAHWAALLGAAVAAPDMPLGDLAMLPPGEAAELRALSLGARHAIPEATLHALIERTIARQPDALAVTCGDTAWTYAELGARADAVAEALRDRGVAQGALVALCVERSCTTVAAILGILKTGAAYVPLDPSFPPARLASILADADPAVLICDTPNRLLCARWQGPVLAMEDVPCAPLHPVKSAAGTPESLAYIIYTSGSTGVPKGVEIEHRGVVNVVGSMRRQFDFTRADTMLAVSRVTFDMSVPDLFLPLIAGGTLAMAPGGSVVDPALLAALIEQSGCSVLQATPATWQLLVANGWPGKPGLKAICGGEALGRVLADELLDRGLQLWNGYGPTEATIYTTMDRITRDEPITIGRPIDNVEVLLLDERGAEVPCNVVAHLHIAGPGLARRYRDPALTGRAFVDRGGQRLYCTGDLALRRRDGRIEWWGRNDGQIKIRGFRMNVGDVEAALRQCPGVAMAAVKAVDGSAGARSDLAAYVTPRRGETAPDFATMRACLSAMLPAYMIPTRYMVLDRMPLCSSGKIQRSALPDIPAQAIVWQDLEDAEPPVGEVESRVAAIWREVLGRDTVGATDDFFDLGGHSLLAAKLIGRLSEEFGQRLPFATMMRAPTVRQLAALLGDVRQPEASPRTIVLGNGTGRPLYWLDATPNFRVDYFRDLAIALGREVTLVGLPVDTEKFARAAADACLHDIVAEMAETIAGGGHRGPHLLGGWCNGGTLAVAVANQLRARGEAVEAVIMLDTTNQARYRWKVQRLQLEIAQFINSPGDEKGAYVREMLAGYGSRLRRRIVPARDEATALRNTADRYARIIRAMPPPSYDGRIIDVRPLGGVGGRFGRWEGLLTGPIDAVRVPGGHQSVFHPPYVAELARALLAGIATGEAPRAGDAGLDAVSLERAEA